MSLMKLYEDFNTREWIAEYGGISARGKTGVEAEQNLISLLKQIERENIKTNFSLTTFPISDKGLNDTVIFLTEPAKKEVIEALKTLEAAKRKLQALLK